ncbi:MAG: response regulator [Cyanobacteria bacterium SZAS TMP-1]|nr:response regulator [Cyanobacteria bacterium SZAS TMP-1]
MTRNFVDGEDIFKHPGADPSGTQRLEKALTDAKDAGVAFFKDAYEHPSHTAMMAGGVALGAMALYAGRNQIARLLPRAGKEVLLVEDTPFMGKAMKSALETNGERVTWVTGFRGANPLVGKTLDGRELLINPNKFKVALVDCELKGSYLQGEHVADALRRSGLPSIGTSSVPESNLSLLANGANVAGQKTAILSGLASNKLDLMAAAKTPATLQHQLDDLFVKLKGPEGKELRRQGDKLLQKFLIEE